MAAKKSKTKTAKTPVKKPVVYAPIPNVLVLSKQTGTTLWQYRAVLGGVTAVYGLLVLLFVRGFGSGFDVTAVRDQFANKLAGSLSASAQLIGNGSGSTQSGSGFQVILLVMVSLALIWSLRQVLAGTKVTVKQAFYYGMYPLVPFLLVVGVLCLQLVPMAIGSSLYQVMVVSGIVTTGLEVALAALLALGLSVVSLYLITPTIVALYIVTLAEMTPLPSLRAAKKLVRGRRWTILRKLLFLPLLMVLAGALLLTPVILLLPVVAGWLMFVLGILFVPVIHTYLYNLYRVLLNEA